MKKKLNEVFTIEMIIGQEENTIFDELCSTNSFPLVADFINNNNVIEINDEYFIGYSAEKYISPFLSKMLDAYENRIDEVNEKLARTIYRRFGSKWKKIYDALMTEYKPLENYSMEEVRTPDLTFEETQNAKNKSTSNRTTKETTGYKGFNASNPVTTTKVDGTEDVEVSGSANDNEVHKTTEHTGTETLKRSGNIGVTTSQQMLESEFKVRQYDFYKMIYNDIDSILCLSIY